MKSFQIMFLFVLAALGAIWGCNQTPLGPPRSPIPIPATPTPTTTGTPTPVCGMTSITLPPEIVTGPYAASVPSTVIIPNSINHYGSAEFFVIRNLTDWQNFYGTAATPPPPVNFATQMILAATYQPCLTTVSFVSACEGSSGVTVSVHDYDNGYYYGFYCLTVLYPLPNIAVAVPFSPLPVTWLAI
jgi:hypothetical protein